jgi:hypothetical protein
MTDFRPWDACNGNPCTCPSVLTPAERERARLIDALNLIARGGCETFTQGSSCRDAHSGRTRGAHYGAGKWCDACIANEALCPRVIP